MLWYKIKAAEIAADTVAQKGDSNEMSILLEWSLELSASYKCCMFVIRNVQLNHWETGRQDNGLKLDPPNRDIVSKHVRQCKGILL